MTFAEKLLRKRRQLGLSQEALAEKIDVSRQAVSRWELGTAVPDAAKLLLLSDLFGVSVDALLREEIDIDAPAQPDTKECVQGKKGGLLCGIGIALALLALAGLLVLGILASLESGSYTASYELHPDGTLEQVPMDGPLATYLQIHHLGWLFTLCAVCAPVCILVALLPMLLRRIRK